MLLSKQGARPHVNEVTGEIPKGDQSATQGEKLNAVSKTKGKTKTKTKGKDSPDGGD